MNVMFPFVVFNYSFKKNKEQHLNYIKMTCEKMEDQIIIVLKIRFKNIINSCM
jgi:hypothetical protein